MRLGIDLDGVVVDFANTANRWLAEQAYGRPGYLSTLTPPEVIDKWDWFDKYPDGEKLWKKLWRQEVGNGMFLRCPPIPGALDALRMLRRTHELHFVTHRSTLYEADTVAWLRLNGLGDIPLHHEKDKSVVAWDLHLDDKAETVEELVAAGRKAVLFAQPWNKSHWLSVPTVHGWGEFVSALNGWVMV